MQYKKLILRLSYLLFFLLIIIVSVLLIWYFNSGNKIYQELSIRQSDIVVVKADTRTVWIVDGELQPPVLTIGVGDTVRWVNKSQNKYKIISVTPKARYLPSLQTNALLPNDSFSFSFTIPGDWRYYLTGNPTEQGRIIIQ